MALPNPILEVLAAFRPLFTAPTWRKLIILLTGTLLAHGCRTVAAALRHTGLERETNFSHIPSSAQSSALVASGREPSVVHLHCRNLHPGRRHGRRELMHRCVHETLLDRRAATGSQPCDPASHLDEGRIPCA
ncbi:hypothetical protein [Ktedonospora formicarum]|uniref:hypothetical protein n=1 Tax=Ktedonospora formicarum TaxID=2778364 RepID=UPI001C68DA1F|nr:hypothetical protein [Ktedonospora formicarum]